MAKSDKPNRETYKPGNRIWVAALSDYRTVTSAQFDSKGRCTEWTDEHNVTRRHDWTVG